jgi:hypothetical protein
VVAVVQLKTGSIEWTHDTLHYGQTLYVTTKYLNHLAPQRQDVAGTFEPEFDFNSFRLTINLRMERRGHNGSGAKQFYCLFPKRARESQSLVYHDI